MKYAQGNRWLGGDDEGASFTEEGSLECQAFWEEEECWVQKAGMTFW